MVEHDPTQFPPGSWEDAPAASHAASAPRAPVETQPIAFWLIIRRIAFALGLGLFMFGLGEGLFDREAPAAVMGWGGGLVGLCIPLGPLPRMMSEPVPMQKRRA